VSTVLTEAELKKAVSDGDLIKNASAESIEGLKYDFRLGTRVLFGRQAPMDLTAAGQPPWLRPGELAYVLSEERLNLPPDVKAELSNKRKMSHAGGLVLGGFAIDPGYKGRLMFALYNISSTPFMLQPGKKLIAAQFYRLAPSETPPLRVSEPVDDFPDDIVRLMSVYAPVSFEGLQKSVDEFGVQLENLRRDFEKKEVWYTDFQRLLEENGRQVKSLTDGLKDETANRKESEREFKKSLEEIQRRVTWSAATIAVVAALVVAVVSGVLLKVLKLA
jgi:deoxycytidine triphosphate deaminase